MENTYRQSTSDEDTMQYRTYYKKLSNSLDMVEKPPEVENLDVSEEVTLPYMLSGMVATIIDEAIERLNVLAECNNALRVHKALLEYNSLLTVKYGVKPAPPTDVDSILYPLHCEENKLSKMMSDRVFCQKVLQELYVEICVENTYKQLLDAVWNKDKDIRYPLVLEDIVNQNKNRNRELKKNIRSLRNATKTALYEMENISSGLQSSLQDEEQTSNITKRYAERWQRARLEQHSQTIGETEGKSLNAIRDYKSKMDQESRVHDENERFQDAMIKDQLQEIEDIMKKYEEDIEKMDLRVQIMSSDYKNMQESRIAIEIELSKREIEMQNWNKFKKEREDALRYTKLMTERAIIVQAWWRGLLVRKKLGPFRPKSERRGRNKQ